MGDEKFFNQNPKDFGSKKYLGPKNIWVQKNLGLKKFWIQKIFWVYKIVGTNRLSCYFRAGSEPN